MTGAIVLIKGNPGTGKTTLAKKFQEGQGYYIISLDRAYVDFIRTQFSEYYFPLLRHQIAQQFDCIACSCCDDIPLRWREHVCTLAVAALNTHTVVVIEGYLLKALVESDYDMLKEKARIIKIEVILSQGGRRQYSKDGKPVSFEEIISEASPARGQ